MHARSQALPAAIAISFALVVVRWPLGLMAAGAMAAGTLGLWKLWFRSSFAREQPRLAVALGWTALPVAVGLFSAVAGTGGWEAISLVGLALACAPLAVATAPGPSRVRSDELARATVVSIPVLWALASLARPDSPWRVGLAAVPFVIALVGGLREVRLAERARADELGALRLGVAGLSRGRHEVDLPGEVVGMGASQLLEELRRWREALVRAQVGSSGSGPRLLGSSSELEKALAADRRGADAWAEALGVFHEGVERLRAFAEQISRHMAEASRSTLQVNLAASEDERGVAGFFTSMEELNHHSLSVADAVRLLNVRMQQVGTIVQAITGIADRAELLAVNAELESNRAGGVEGAFALLAGEMRRISERVIGSARVISAQIDEVVHVSTAAASAANAAVVATQESTAQGRELTDRLVELLGSARKTAQAVADIEAALSSQRLASFRLHSCGQFLARVANEAIAVVSRLESAGAELRSLGTTLSSGSRT